MLKTTANKITVLRIILIPVWLCLAYRGHALAALTVYIVACLSDMADGYIARHYNQITNFGKFMDPLADKMLVLAAMCYFVEEGQMPDRRHDGCPWSDDGISLPDTEPGLYMAYSHYHRIFRDRILCKK